MTTKTPFTIIIDCRSTGAGSFTAPVERSDGVTVHEYGHSRTGNHWQVELTIPAGGWVEIRDLSGSGKHSCYRLHGDGSCEDICNPYSPPACG